MDVIPSERVCPGCGSSRQALIVYGLVESTADLRAQIEAGSLVLGGCGITGHDPEWYCLDCRREWGDSRQSRRLLESAGHAGPGRPATLGGRIGVWALSAILFVPLKILWLVIVLVVATLRAGRLVRWLVERWCAARPGGPRPPGRRDE